MINAGKAMEKLSDLSASASGYLTTVRRWWGPLWNLLTFSLMDGMIMPKKSLSVSLERGCVWVVLGSRFLSKIKVKGVRKYTFEEGRYATPDSLASSLSLAAKELKAPQSAITLSIPRDWAIVRNVELPLTVKETVTDVVAYELDRLTPLSADSAYYDFRITGEDADKLKLIIVATRADVINQYREALKRESIDLEAVTINLANITILCDYMGKGPDAVCLAVDSFGYEGGLLRNGSLVASNGGTFPEGNMSQQQESVEKGIGTLVKTARDQGISPSVLVYIKDQYRLALDKVLDLPVTFLTEESIRKRFFTENAGLSGSAAGGILQSLWSGAKGLNLLNKGVTKKVPVPVACTVFLMVAFIAAWIPYFVLPLQREEKRLAEITRQISLRKDEVRKVEALKKEVELLSDEVATIDQFKDPEPRTLLLLKELTSVLPKTAWVTRTRFTDTTADIEGYANSASEILPKLEQSKYFKRVEFASPTIRDARLNADRFVIKMEIEGLARPESDKPKPVAEKPKPAGEKPKDGKKK